MDVNFERSKYYAEKCRELEGAQGAEERSGPPVSFFSGEISSPPGSPRMMQTYSPPELTKVRREQIPSQSEPKDAYSQRKVRILDWYQMRFFGLTGRELYKRVMSLDQQGLSEFLKQVESQYGAFTVDLCQTEICPEPFEASVEAFLDGAWNPYDKPYDEFVREFEAKQP